MLNNIILVLFQKQNDDANDDLIVIQLNINIYRQIIMEKNVMQ